MNGSQMNCVILPVVFILVLCCGSGYMLNCYNCPLTVGPCKTNITCPNDLDSCLLLEVGEKTLRDCYRFSKCNIKAIEDTFKTSNFIFKCCQKNLCNASPTMIISEAVFITTLTVTVIWMLGF